MGIRVFISYSGIQSEYVAGRLREHLKLVCMTAELWMASADLTVGDAWLGTVLNELQATDFGIICVHRTNLSARWLNFEAGALVTSLGRDAVMPYLIDCTTSDLTGPLSMFHAATADKDGTLKLASALHRKLRERQESHLSEGELKKVFEKMWPDYQSQLAEAPKQPIPAGPERSTKDILAELLMTARTHTRLLGSILRGGRRLPFQFDYQASGTIPEEDYQRLRYEELRYEAMSRRRSGQYAEALDLLQKALGCRPGDLETLIDIAVTLTYFPNAVYEHSIQKLRELIREHTASEHSPQPEESIVAKAYYNSACIKHLARVNQGAPYTDEDVFADFEQALIRYPTYIVIALDDQDLSQLWEHPTFKGLVEKHGRGNDDGEANR